MAGFEQAYDSGAHLLYQTPAGFFVTISGTEYFVPAGTVCVASSVLYQNSGAGNWAIVTPQRGLAGGPN